MSASGPVSDKLGVIAPEIVEQAIAWKVRFGAGVVDPQDHAACEAWIAASPEHAHAWQRLSSLQHGLGAASTGGLPPATARRIIDQAFDARRRLALKSIAGLGTLAGSAWLFTGHTSMGQALAADHRTATGERQQLMLADGSRVLLDTGTALDVRYDDRARRLLLHAGQIEVVAAPGPQARPFSVVTDNGSVSLIDGRFSLGYGRLGAPDEPGRNHVAVMQGSVDVRTRQGEQTIRLNAGWQAGFGEQQVVVPESLKPEVVAWTQGILLAEQMRLVDFAAELDRYRRGRLRCDPEVAGLRVTGSFPLQAPDAVLALLEEALPVKVQHIAGLWSTIGPR